jgi:hypothetical protein
MFGGLAAAFPIRASSGGTTPRTPPRRAFGPQTGGGGCGVGGSYPQGVLRPQTRGGPPDPQGGFGPTHRGGSSCPFGAGFVGKTGALERYFNVPCLPSSSRGTPSSLAAGVRCGRRPQRVLLEAPVTALMHDRVPYRSPGAPNSPQSSDFGLEAQSVMLVLRMGVLRLTCGGTRDAGIADGVARWTLGWWVCWGMGEAGRGAHGCRKRPVRGKSRSFCRTDRADSGGLRLEAD